MSDQIQGSSLRDTQPDSADSAGQDWRGAADGLCAEMLKQAPAQARKVADTLYETLLDTVQDYLRENVDYNLSADLKRAKRGEDCANNSLRLVAVAVDVEVKGFPNYPTPAMIADLCIAKVERIAETMEALNAALAKAVAAQSPTEQPGTDGPQSGPGVNNSNPKETGQ